MRLPEMQDALLDDATLDRLLADLEGCTEILEVRVKGGARQHADDRPRELRESAAELRAGTIRGLQVGYLHEGREWWDTLTRTDVGVRLVRIGAPDGR